MKTTWDYTSLAYSYLKRPNYSVIAIDSMLSIIKGKRRDKFCDIGAGVAHLTLMLADRDLDITAIEPNDAMRKNGINRTKGYSNVTWHEGTGEETAQDNQTFDVVTFGSSFNVCDRYKALKETARILKPKGWFVCMWNHRCLDDPIQDSIEKIIKDKISAYGYGSRREDQTKIINSSGYFGPVIRLSSEVLHEQQIEDCVEAWRSHATLERQANEKFHEIIKEIEEYLISLGKKSIHIPYVTNIWLAQLK